MAKILLLVGLVLIIAAILAFSIRNRSRTAQQASTKGNAAYLGLRDQILGGSRSKFSLPASSRPTGPWGVVMDWDVQSGTATVVAMSDGSASIYLSNGGGSIGGIGQEPIRNAAKKAVSLAADVQPHMKETTRFPIPEAGQVQFHVLTDTGVFAATVPEADLRAGRGPFSNLGNAMQDIVTAYRIYQERAPS